MAKKQLKCLIIANWNGKKHMKIENYGQNISKKNRKLWPKQKTSTKQLHMKINKSNSNGWGPRKKEQFKRANPEIGGETQSPLTLPNLG